MSQANVKRAILQESCSAKYYFLKDSLLLNQREKNALEKVANLVNAYSSEEEFTLMEKYLSDLMLVAKLRHESEQGEIMERLTTRMGDHTDAMTSLARRLGEQ